MTRYSLEIRIKPRPGLLDPEGKAIHHALHSLGWDEVDEVRVELERSARAAVSTASGGLGCRHSARCLIGAVEIM